MHAIQFLSDDAMPDGHDFLFVQIPNGALIFYRESAISPEVLEDSWAAYRALRRTPPVEPTVQDEAAWIYRVLSLVA